MCLILFDKWRRYKHCVSENNPLKENRAVYYINNIENLEKCIKTLSISKNINFEKHKKTSNFEAFFQYSLCIKKIDMIKIITWFNNKIRLSIKKYKNY